MNGFITHSNDVISAFWVDNNSNIQFGHAGTFCNSWHWPSTFWP